MSTWRAELARAVSREDAVGAGEAGRAEKWAGEMNPLGRRAETHLGASVQLGLSSAVKQQPVCTAPGVQLPSSLIDLITSVSPGLCCGGRMQSHKISCCVHLVSAPQGDRLVCESCLAWLAGSLLLQSLCCRLGFTRLKNQTLH